MKLKSLAVAAALTLAGTTGIGASASVPAFAGHASHAVVSVDKHHKCTRTSTGHCIRGGEFCPQAKYGHSGWDAAGRRWVCRGNHTHPHWMHPRR
jgi:hypothetical protein